MDLASWPCQHGDTARQAADYSSDLQSPLRLHVLGTGFQNIRIAKTILGSKHRVKFDIGNPNSVSPQRRIVVLQFVP